MLAMLVWRHSIVLLSISGFASESTSKLDSLDLRIRIRILALNGRFQPESTFEYAISNSLITSVTHNWLLMSSESAASWTVKAVCARYNQLCELHNWLYNWLYCVHAISDWPCCNDIRIWISWNANSYFSSEIYIIFLRYLFAHDVYFTFCDLDTVVFLITSTVVTHRRLMVIS